MDARVRRTALGLVDTYATWFTTQPPEALGAPLGYVLGGLADAEPGVCLQVRPACPSDTRVNTMIRRLWPSGVCAMLIGARLRGRLVRFRRCMQGLGVCR